MKINFKFKSASLRNFFRKKFMYAWIKRYKIVFSLLFILLTAFSAFEWYRSLDNYHWTDQEKNDYLKRTITETSFQEAKFKEALDSLQKLQSEHATPSPEIRDVFQGKKKKE